MKYIAKTLLAALLVLTFTGSFAQAQDKAVYELRTYLTNDGKLDDLNARFKDHTIAFFDKYGMESVGYWIPVDTPNTLIYIIRHKSMDAAKQSWANFSADEDWKVVAIETNKNGAILVEAPHSVYMTATDYSLGYLK